MRKVLLGVAIGLVTAVVTAAIVVFTGAIDMKAGPHDDPLDWVGQRLLASSVARRAPDDTSPLDDRRAAAMSGYHHYRDTCVLCHGAPGVPPAELAEGLAPRAPRLHSERVQSRSDGELFHLIKAGVRMTGMPSFGLNHSDREIWELVAFIRSLDELSEEQRRELRDATRTHGHEGAMRGPEMAEAGEHARESTERATAHEHDQSDDARAESASHAHEHGAPQHRRGARQHRSRGAGDGRERVEQGGGPAPPGEMEHRADNVGERAPPSGSEPCATLVESLGLGTCDENGVWRRAAS